MNYSKSDYAKKFQTKKWQKKRAKILKRDGFKCQSDYCSAEDGMMHVHHIIYLKDRDPWDYDDYFLITLCEECHERVHTINIKDLIVEHVIIYGIDKAIKEFFSVSIIDRILDMWNGGGNSIHEWYEKELEIIEYLKSLPKPITQKNKNNSW